MGTVQNLSGKVIRLEGGTAIGENQFLKHMIILVTLTSFTKRCSIRTPLAHKGMNLDSTVHYG